MEDPTKKSCHLRPSSVALCQDVSLKWALSAHRWSRPNAGKWCKNGCVMTQESATQWSHAPQTCRPHLLEHTQCLGPRGRYGRSVDDAPRTGLSASLTYRRFFALVSCKSTALRPGAKYAVRVVVRSACKTQQLYFSQIQRQRTLSINPWINHGLSLTGSTGQSTPPIRHSLACATACADARVCDSCDSCRRRDH